MATLAQDKPRAFGVGDFNELPVIASDIIFEGAAVGDNASGLARPLVAADPFLGFAKERCDNSAGAASARNVKVFERGKIELDVTGVASAADVGETVYASDDDTFTLTSAGNSAVGKVVRWVSGTRCVVYFEGVQVRSL
jgi:hypothetical protein